MHFEINDGTRFREIQETFSNFYPYLKVDFFRKPHKKYEASLETDRLEADAVVGDIRLTHVSGVLEILPSYRIADVEEEFMKRFGLSVQILLREENKWIQTAGMDDFTLKELNEFGRDSSDEFIVSEYEENFEEIEEKPEKLL